MEFKCGYVSILGRPNVGKSTLLNKLFGQKISIVSPKPQTTRNVVTGILNLKDMQVVFLDTPGIHKSKNSLDKYMEKSIQQSLEGIDLIFYILDGTKRFFQEDIDEINKLSTSKTPVVVLVSKVDDTTFEKLYPELAKLNNLKNVKEIIPFSSFNGKNGNLIVCFVSGTIISIPLFFSVLRGILNCLNKYSACSFAWSKIPYSIA